MKHTPRLEKRTMQTTENVPERVLDFVRSRLDVLREHERVLSAIDRFCGPYHARCSFHELTAKIASVNADLDEFRDLANLRGVDPEAVIDKLGGLPNLLRFGGEL